MSINPDKHLVFISNVLDVPLAASSFANIRTFNAFKQLLSTYAPSTAENYAWRLHRYLSTDPSFSPIMLSKYADFLASCKAHYPPTK